MVTQRAAIEPQALVALGSATLGESGARITSPRLRPAWPGAQVAGPVLPVRCSPGDNLAIHVAVAHGGGGGVLVVDVGGAADRGYFGEVLTTAAESVGLAGLVIDGGVRDVDALCSHRFPVFSTTIALRGATKSLPGAVGQPVRVGGSWAAPGDWVVADSDGVVFIPGDRVDQVVAQARSRAEREQGYFAALRGEATTVELLGLDEGLVSRG